MGSQERVTASVQGANPHSFFRTTEIFAIMNNPEVKEVEILMEDMSKAGKDGHGPVESSGSMPKKEAYQELRDGWLDSSIKKYEDTYKAYEKYKQDRKNHTDEKEKACREAVLSARSNLATEYVIAQKMSQETNPFTKNGLYKANADIAYGEEERAGEKERLKQIEAVKGIGKEFGRSAEVKKEELKQASEAMSAVDKIICTAMELGNTLEGEKKRDFTRLATNFINDKKAKEAEKKETQNIAKPTSLIKNEEQEKVMQNAAEVFKNAGVTESGNAKGVQNSSFPAKVKQQEYRGA